MGVDGEMEMLRLLIFFGTCCILVYALGVHVSPPVGFYFASGCRRIRLCCSCR